MPRVSGGKIGGRSWKSVLLPEDQYTKTVEQLLSIESHTYSIRITYNSASYVRTIVRH